MKPETMELNIRAQSEALRLPVIEDGGGATFPPEQIIGNNEIRAEQLKNAQDFVNSIKSIVGRSRLDMLKWVFGEIVGPALEPQGQPLYVITDQAAAVDQGKHPELWANLNYAWFPSQGNPEFFIPAQNSVDVITFAHNGATRDTVATAIRNRALSYVGAIPGVGFSP
jgi:hypothetical protein